MPPTKEEMVKAMDTLKAADCKIDTMMDHDNNIILVVYVPLEKME